MKDLEQAPQQAPLSTVTIPAYATYVKMPFLISHRVTYPGAILRVLLMGHVYVFFSGVGP